MNESGTLDPARFRPRQRVFVGIDSDGCAFDTMEIKQKDFFHPAIIRHWGLASIEPQVRAAAEFVYLYSVHRGLNRFLGLCKTFELLREWPEAADRAALPDPAPLRRWCDAGGPLDNASLLAEADRTDEPLLRQAGEWSARLNAAIERDMPDPPPFPGVEEALRRMTGRADLVVVSQTQTHTLLNDWRRAGFDRLVDAVAGAEAGGKVDHFRQLAVGRYPRRAMLMIGDAPGDLATARAVGCAFYPILPGAEAESWKRFLDVDCERFFAEGLSDERQRELNEAFMARLPAEPPWTTGGA